MAFSTEAQLTNNVKAIAQALNNDATKITAFATERIALADKKVTVDLLGYVDVSGITDDSVLPVNLLSQCKAAELSHVRLGSVKRNKGASSDAEYWQGCYNDLLEKILKGKVPVEDGSGNDLTTRKGRFAAPRRGNGDIKPIFGYGEYGQYVDEDQLEDDRDSIDGATGN